ncbi:MAG: 3-dehydroquinate synthase [Neisseriaceae bacterium]|nr:3-dehydroquinate synthase [Neisseriaceae bacterium]
MILSVNTPSHTYPIYIGASLIQLLQRYSTQHIDNNCTIVTNETIAPLYLKSVTDVLKSAGKNVYEIILPDGESYKNIETLQIIYDGLMQQRMERRSTLIALGGGVIGDMTGFAAATYQRGMPFVQIPTTLLSQVDSSVGGKTGINHPLGKNMIGAFYQPQAVFAGLDTLHTLPKREFSAGMAEVIKYALLGDIEFLQWIEQHIEPLMALDNDSLAYAVEKCCAMKADIVAADEKENGQRALLNLGHTFGHAIETQMGYGTWLHGEAVSAGMVVACHLSERMGFISSEDTLRVNNLLQKASLPNTPPEFPFERWIEHMKHDKKVSAGKIRFVVLESLGHAIIKECSDIELLKDCLSAWLPK